MVNWDLVSYLVVIVFSIGLGLILSFFFGYYAIPKYQYYRLCKRSLKKIGEQEEKGFKYYSSIGSMRDIKLSEVIERKQNENTG